MESSIFSGSVYEPGQKTYQEGNGMFCATPFLEPVCSAFSSETFLLPLSESCLNPTIALSGTYDGMCGDGETLPRFALRFRRPSSARLSFRTTKESQCRNT